MKLAIIGSRSFNNFPLADKIFLDFFKKDVTVIVSGCAAGADTVAEQIAEKYNIEKLLFPAVWQDFSEPCVIKEKNGRKYNALAGFNRNTQIIVSCDQVLAFWNGSPGTKDSLDKAKKLGKQIFIVWI